MKEVVHFWKVDVDNIDDEDLQGIKIKESEGEHMLALDQVLRKPWSGVTTFWTSTHWSRKERPGRANIMDLTDFASYVDPVRGSLGFL
jgi:hypothetical protein